jgi:hypothetical protein
MRKNGGNIYGMKCEKDDDIDDGIGDDESELMMNIIVTKGSNYLENVRAGLYYGF